MTDPGRHIDAGNTVVLGFGFSDVPRETSFGFGERGVLKGCAAEVEVAAGGLEGGAAVVASRRGIEDVREREKIEGRREDALLRRQERQIIFVVLC